MKKRWKEKMLCDVCIVDRFLLIFLFFLFLYIIIDIFLGTAASQEGNTIDIIVRTSMAAIFGYFISSNFSEKAKSNTLSAQSTDSEETFSESPAPARHCSRVQITIVASIGLFSMIILFVTRFYQELTPEFSATISQLRDFVSAGIGFLISCGKNISE